MSSSLLNKRMRGSTYAASVSVRLFTCKLDDCPVKSGHAAAVGREHVSTVPVTRFAGGNGAVTSDQSVVDPIHFTP